jgi:hypothetical protein
MAENELTAKQASLWRALQDSVARRESAEQAAETRLRDATEQVNQEVARVEQENNQRVEQLTQTARAQLADAFSASSAALRRCKAESRVEDIVASLQEEASPEYLKRAESSDLSPAEQVQRLTSEAVAKNKPDSGESGCGWGAWLIPPLWPWLILMALVNLLGKLSSGFSNRLASNAYQEAIEWARVWVTLTKAEYEPRIAEAKATAVDATSAALIQREVTFRNAVAARDRDVRQARYEFVRQTEVLLKPFAEYTHELAQVSPPWSGAAWQSYCLPSQAASAVRIGQMRRAVWERSIEAPGILALPLARPLLVRATAADRDRMVKALQSLLLRLLAQNPPGAVRFTFLDPVGLGESVAPFMQLADYDDALVTGKAWSEAEHMEQRLVDLTEHMENVIQKYLRTDYASIEEFNRQAGEVAEPYRVLVVFDFPARFGESSARRLLSIVRNGPRCGVHTIIQMSGTPEMPYGFDLGELERLCTVIEQKGDAAVWHEPDFEQCALALDVFPEKTVVDRIVKVVGEAAAAAKRVEVPFERLAPATGEAWQEHSEEGLRAALGPSGARKVQYLELGQGTAQHALVVGKTGSGKSNLLHVLINHLALSYSPEELQLYLVDFKKGVEFKTYASHMLPHARVVAIESEREFGLSVLQGLDAELRRRGDLFRQAGVDHIAAYRGQTGATLPRILLLVDEFQEFFTEDDSLASQSAQILDRLVRQGRAFGMHVLLGSQTLAGAYSLARSTIDQMAVRIALQCTEADSRLILAEDNPAARLLSRPGEAIYNAANGLIEGNNVFQVAWLPDEKRDTYLAMVRELDEAAGRTPSPPPIVFEGNAPALLTMNRGLEELLEGETWPGAARRVLAWVGEPVAIKESTSAAFRRQSGSNLLIVGQNEEAATAMMESALLSLAAQEQPLAEALQFCLLDFTSVDQPFASALTKLGEGLPHKVQVSGRRGLPEAIAAIAQEVNARINGAQSGWPSLYVLVHGLQRARDLRPDDTFGYVAPSQEGKPPSPAQQFAEILREGPDMGVHTLVWCDTVNNLNRSLDRRALREFGNRIALQMTAEDSAGLIETPAASKLGPYRGLLFAEDEGRVDKFRPYALPDAEWLDWVLERLRSRN